MQKVDVLDIRGSGYDEILRSAQNDKQADSPCGMGLYYCHALSRAWVGEVF